jgi:predicted short-subunit dehydrogenase-like oxidoreductase (DUF2520 family)
MAAAPPWLNIIGAGRVARALGRLWRAAGVFQVRDVVSRTLQGANDAAAFIGGGHAAQTVAGMREADAWLIATPDGAIESSACVLRDSGLLRAGDVVFHCSGALPSAILAVTHGASAHPLKSFAEPAAAGTLAGTYCAVEGDAHALAVLRPAFTAIGARVIDIDPARKTLYHAASVLVCNKLTALMEAGLRCYEEAGIARDAATRMMEPLVRETLENVFKLGTTRALTGPVVRGDVAVVEKQLRALSELDPRLAEIYRALGLLATELAQAQDGKHTEALIHALTHAPRG